MVRKFYRICRLPALARIHIQRFASRATLEAWQAHIPVPPKAGYAKLTGPFLLQRRIRPWRRSARERAPKCASPHRRFAASGHLFAGQMTWQVPTRPQTGRDNRWRGQILPYGNGSINVFCIGSDTMLDKYIDCFQRFIPPHNFFTYVRLRLRCGLSCYYGPICALIVTNYCSWPAVFRCRLWLDAVSKASERMGAY